MAPAGLEIMNNKYNLFIVLPVDYYTVLIDYVRMGCYQIFVSTTGFYKIGFRFLVLISVYGLIFDFKYSHIFQFDISLNKVAMNYLCQQII